MNVTATLLSKARELIEKGWAQHHYAMGPAYFIVPFGDKQATRFCMIGACKRARKDLGVDKDEEAKAEQLLMRCIHEKGSPWNEDMIDFNDKPGRTQTEVLAVFDCALEHAKEQPDGNAAV